MVIKLRTRALAREESTPLTSRWQQHRREPMAVGPRSVRTRLDRLRAGASELIKRPPETPLADLTERLVCHDGSLIRRSLMGPILLVTLVFVLFAARGSAVADVVTQATIVRETIACQSPWPVLNRGECQILRVGTEVDVVSGDEFFACIMWRNTQRCKWVARDVLRKR
jgi:hypothetical protein